MKIESAGEPIIFDVNTFTHFHLFWTVKRGRSATSVNDELMEIISEYLTDHPVNGSGYAAD